MYSVLIRGGLVIDGSGRPGTVADLAINAGRIVDVAPNIVGAAERVIDADGLAVCPGFIDIHSHTDGTIFAHPLSESKLLQGVTSEVVGNCGIGMYPVTPERREPLAEYLALHEFNLPNDGLAWRGLGEYASALTGRGIGLNILPLVAHGALRIAAMGFDDRRPTPEELDAMRELLVADLAEGAWGMSTGLIYPPGSFADTEELIALARLLAQYQSMYASHIRNEGREVSSALDEAIRIGRESGARTEVSHLKVMGVPNWGKGEKCIQLLAAARSQGVDIGADQYPYDASSTSLTALVPQWAHAGGVSALLARIEAPDLGARLRPEIRQELEARGGAERVMIAGVGSARNESASGRTVAALAAEWSLGPESAVMRLLTEERGAVGAVYFSMSEKDVVTVLTDPHVAIGSDGCGMSATADAGQMSHPRSYGTFVRVLGHYARDLGVLSFPEAVRKMTGLPAERLRLNDRGLIAPGFAADITIVDPVAVRDNGTFTDPHRYASGVPYVLVNGEIAVEDGKPTGRPAGRVLLKSCMSRVNAGWRL